MKRNRPRQIRSEEEYKAALATIDELARLPLGSDAAEDLDGWVQAVDEWEAEHPRPEHEAHEDGDADKRPRHRLH